MGRFDYPSPYWDSVGDPALDLIDRMLTVDVEKRITVDECLEHHWITQRKFNPADSTDGLTGAMGHLDFSKRKYSRERTLLSSINDVKVSQIVETDEKIPIKVFEKNANGKRAPDTPAENEAKSKSNGHIVKQEDTPAGNRAPEIFMQLGGKGDPPLFEDDHASRYNPDEVPE